MSDFVNFLKHKKEQEVDWAEVKREWLSSLQGLCTQFKSWLEEAQREKLISITDKEISLEEQGLGYYQAPGLIISFSKNYVEVKPVGRLIFGAQGRVDLISYKGNVKILRNGQDNTWSISSYNDQQQVEYKPLTQELFLEIIKDMFS